MKYVLYISSHLIKLTHIHLSLFVYLTLFVYLCSYFSFSYIFLGSIKLSCSNKPLSSWSLLSFDYFKEIYLQKSIFSL